MSAEYPDPCCRCGMCCLAETCPIGQLVYRIKKDDKCPALTFNDNIAHCNLVEFGLVPVGEGCCIKARAYRNGIEYDFSELPVDIKYRAVKDMRRRNG
jgi:hypothetical protein